MDIFRACEYGYVDFVKQYIEDGGDVHVRKDDWSLLHHTSLNGNLKVCQLLIEHGNDVNDTTSSRYTPLHLACINGNFEVCKLLLQSGANSTITNSYGQTPIDVAKNDIIRNLLSGKNTKPCRK